ncbi:MAG: PQQ-dependent sugar dehydrogenase, partial [Planctomycetota bacterium]
AGTAPDDPAFYVTELYGTIKVVTNAGAVSDYATGLLNFNPTGNFPGSGEQGLAGIVVEPNTGDVFVTRVTDTDGLPGGEHHPQVVRFTSNDGGMTAATETVVLDMIGESQGQSHQISNISIGPDGKLYVHNGDGFDASTALNLSSYRGKILRLNLDGTPAIDNPFYDAGNGINATDYIYAYGVRNPFGGAWRASHDTLYEVENGPSVDRLVRVDPGGNYGWDGSDASMFTGAVYNWVPAHAPVNITFVQPESFGGSGFPVEKYDRAFVSESGPTYAPGPQSRGKRIVEFEFDAAGNVIGGPQTLVEYVGTGRATVVGLTTGPDGLYFTDLYKDQDAQTPIDAGARVLRVRYVPPRPDSDLNDDGQLDCQDVDALVSQLASGVFDPAFDLSGDGLLNNEDLTIWLSEAGGVNLSSGNPYLPGDANLDGVVDGQDFVIWNNNKFSNTAAWCAGDFNADGLVDGRDFIVWNGSKFQSADNDPMERQQRGWRPTSTEASLTHPRPELSHRAAPPTVSIRLPDVDAAEAEEDDRDQPHEDAMATLLKLNP